MRTHANFVESLPTIVVTLSLGSLFIPQVAMWVAILIAVARLVYTIMYATMGSDSRIVGALAGNIPIYVVLLWVVVKLFIMAF